MAKDTLKQLDLDVERMLFAGAQIARTNPELLAAKHKLSPIAAKIPAIRRVTEQIGSLEQATGKAAATELLDLSVLLAQVRSAQAAPASPTETGDLTALPPAAKISSPLLPAELQTLVGALTNAAESRLRPATIRDAVLRGSACDLRILPLCVPALSDSHIADAVEQTLLPAMGEAIAPELRRALNIESGRSVDQRILRSIARIEGSKAFDVLHDAIEKGGADMRSAAIVEFGRIDPAQAEPIATTLLDKDQSKKVKLAAIGALAQATTDEALEALLRAFGGSDDIRSAAESSLAVSTHLRATDRIVQLFTPELLDLGHFKIRKTTTKEEKDEAAKAQKAHQAKVEYLVDLVNLLAARSTDQTMQMVVETFRTHKIKEVRDTAARALLRMGYAQAWEDLVPSLYDAPEATQFQFIDGTFAFDLTKSYDRLAPFFESKALIAKNGLDFATRILIRLLSQVGIDDAVGPLASIFEKDPRWVDLGIRILASETLRGSAIALLAKAHSPKALEPVLELIRGPISSTNAPILLDFLASYRDPRIPPNFIRILPLLHGAYQYSRACEIFNRYDDSALAPHLRYWLEDRKSRKKMPKGESEPFENCIRFLSRDRNAPKIES